MTHWNCLKITIYRPNISAELSNWFIKIDFHEYSTKMFAYVLHKSSIPSIPIALFGLYDRFNIVVLATVAVHRYFYFVFSIFYFFSWWNDEIKADEYSILVADLLLDLTWWPKKMEMLTDVNYSVSYSFMYRSLNCLSINLI